MTVWLLSRNFIPRVKIKVINDHRQSWASRSQLTVESFAVLAAEIMCVDIKSRQFVPHRSPGAFLFILLSSYNLKTAVNWELGKSRRKWILLILLLPITRAVGIKTWTLVPQSNYSLQHVLNTTTN